MYGCFPTENTYGLSSPGGCFRFLSNGSNLNKPVHSTSACNSFSRQIVCTSRLTANYVAIPSELLALLQMINEADENGKFAPTLEEGYSNTT
jgi:hypothetical protein